MSRGIEELVRLQRDFFESGATLSVDFRREALSRLKKCILAHEEEIYEALEKDLGKTPCESFMCEVGMTLSEISYMQKNIKKFARDKRVRTPMSQFASRSYVKTCPYGNVLIMSPWNYPFLLSLSPLVNAISAGNTAIIKPSAYSPETSRLVDKIISESFPPEYVSCVLGGREENAELLNQKFDFVFFTGSQAVGREVLRHTAEHLTPAVLELGGKSPCIVDDTAKIALSAKRIVFGKLLNCGQTCVAPDYILCDVKIKDELVSEIVKEIKAQYGENVFENSLYGHIVNKKHFDRICGLIDKDKVVFGGASSPETLQIQPTVMCGISRDDAVMKEEIFGPVLPIITYESIDEAIDFVRHGQKPLALYMFSENRQNIKRITSNISYGGGCINDVIIHLATSEMGFGGVGESGMGAYHGKVGFDTFSHHKSIVDKKTWLDLPMRYQPYGKTVMKTLKKFMK